MGSLTRLVLRGFVLAMATMSSASYATCWESGTGSTAVYRNPSVTAEFGRAAFVVTGRVLGERNISTPDDPKGYEWTIYTVQVLEIFKGRPQRTIRLLSENTSSRFFMDIGKTYLLFVSHSSMTETAGQERLPAGYIDNCGNSAPAKDAEPAIKTVRDLSKAR